MKKMIVALMLLTSASIYASDFVKPEFRACEKKENKCEAAEVISEVQAHGLQNPKIIPQCDEVSSFNASGVREITYYECKILVHTKNEVSAMKLRIRPCQNCKGKTSSIKPKFDPSKPFEVVE